MKAINDLWNRTLAGTQAEPRARRSIAGPAIEAPTLIHPDRTA
jgi:hypothetical protein